MKIYEVSVYGTLIRHYYFPTLAEAKADCAAWAEAGEPETRISVVEVQPTRRGICQFLNDTFHALCINEG